MQTACSITDCPKPVTARQMCQMHYRRMRRNGDPLVASTTPRRSRPRNVGVARCTVAGCRKVQQARSWCSAHYTRWVRHGAPDVRLPGEVVDGKRVCPGCKMDKALADYTPGSTGRCKRCNADRRAATRVPGPTAPRTPAVCDACGADFLATKRRRRYCSPECFQVYRHKANWKHVQARRARIRDSFVEAFDRFEIFDRDGWVCQLCDEVVDSALEFPDLGSASLDHIVPVSRGGEHSRANAQTSHLGCNLRKGNHMSILGAVA